MKGFIIFNNKTGALAYHRYYAPGGKLSKLAEHVNPQFDGQDPLQVASHFFALLKMTELMAEEVKGQCALAEEQAALRQGLRSYKSEHLDYFLEHHEQFPLTCVLFYDAELLSEQVMRSLTAKILDVFIYKYEKKFLKGNFSVRPSPAFEQALSVIYEDVRSIY